MILFPKMCICGTGASLPLVDANWYRDTSLIVWGNAMKYFLTTGNRHPGYWLYLDAHAIVDNLQTIIDTGVKMDTTLVRTKPINTVSLQKQLIYCGGCDKHKKFNWTADGYKKYLNLIDKTRSFIDVDEINGTSYHAHYGKQPVNTDVLWWTNYLNSMARQSTYVVTAYRDKLLHCILPIIYMLQYQQRLPSVDLYLYGFDGGIGGRFDNGKPKPKDKRMIKGTHKHLPTWIKIMKTVNVTLHCKVNTTQSIVSEVINGYK